MNHEPSGIVHHIDPDCPDEKVFEVVGSGISVIFPDGIREGICSGVGKGAFI